VSKLSVENVSRQFPAPRGGAPVPALLPVDLTVADNDFLVLLGPSGCGKSTLLRLIAGLDRPTTGRILLDGRPVSAPGPDRGMVFQSYTLFPWLTVADNIAFGLREKAWTRRASNRLSLTGWSVLAWRVLATTTPSSFPAACSSEPLSPGRWQPIRRSFFSMNPLARLIIKHAD